MFWMHKSVDSGRVRNLIVVLAGGMVSLNLSASTLVLEQAEILALEADPGIRSVAARRLALDELAVSAAQLPDPSLKMGLVSLPTDTFDLDQEPMSQVQVGLVQKFPRGHSRSLRSEQIGLKSDGLDEMVRDQRMRIILEVREQYLEVAKQNLLARINSEAIAAFTDVSDITQEYYATGRVHQQDVLQAAVELAKAEDRATRISQSEEQARANLARWIGEAAYSDLAEGWPSLNAIPDAEVIKSHLPNHPKIRALQNDVSVADTGVELARQRYKPEFTLDLTYGGRSGINPDGSSRPDLLSLMLVMDLPLFHGKRQDRVMAARVAESSAALYNLDDILRRMRAEVDFHSATLRNQKVRIELFENSLLPDAAFSSDASFEAYQSSIEDLTTLLRTRITEFDLQFEHARLQSELRKTQARLLYLEGEQS